MKVLLIHSDYLRYQVKDRTPVAEEIDHELKEGGMEECLTVFAAVEKADEGRESDVITRGVEIIGDTARKVGVGRIMLYPYAHLSPSLSNAETAVKVLKGMEDELKDDFTVKRSPFGWYKAFQISCKGHPLSELSREILPEGEKGEVTSKALLSEESMESGWAILDTRGTLHELTVKGDKVEGYDFKDCKNLLPLVVYEAGEKKKGKMESPHIGLMRKHELVDYEPGSDPGNLRYYPKGRMMKGLLEDYVSHEVRKYGAMEIESPIMYDMNHPTLKSYLHRFPARQYTIDTPDKEVFLRFAACFGQFLMAHDMTISYRNLPLRIYELTRYSFRVEQRGELTGLRRLRAFTMPDSHALCRDVEGAKEEMLVRMNLAMSIMDGIGLSTRDDLELVVRCTRDFFNEHREFLATLTENYGKPALLELWDDRFFYFVMKYEFNFVDLLDRASALVTDQIDIENGERYGITYVNEDGEERNPVILHLSPSGAIERVIFSVLEKAAMMGKKGKKPAFPYWLAPTQLRFIPVSEEQTGHADELANSFTDVRADIDDTDRTVGRKIREAEKEWIPYIVVIGEREVSEGTLAVRIRDTGEQVDLTVEELKKRLEDDQGKQPFRELPLPRHLGRRPVFVG